MRRRERRFFVYILASLSRVLYVGVTSDLDGRIYEHKHRSVPGFASRYNINRLVYFEEFGTAGDAISREKQLKGWRRAKKIALIERENPRWNDLAAE